MWKMRGCPGCHSPTLCVIACPKNEILDQTVNPCCEPLPEWLADGEEEFEIVLAENPATADAA
ncbi:MAG: hypothetical protein HY782_06315 [Chloroflexi bacterium]|nr:hypothetical protein [Chloroflexota bacterium]